MKKNFSDNFLLNRTQRIQLLSEQQQWDLIIIGGGITGAGILKLACQQGLKVLLIEQKDFAWGSSSRSSKMIHGGLRYLPEGQFGLTLESVRERQKLLQEADGLVTQQSFVVSHYARHFPWPWIFNLLLWIYDRFAGKKQHRSWSKENYSYLAPGIKQKDSLGGSQFVDAMTDDARLVLRLLQESQQIGALTLNYFKAVQLVKTNDKITGVIVKDEESEQQIELIGKVVVNATGAWANDLFDKTEHSIELRPLRGSHIILPSWRLPVASAISVMHPEDRRPVQIFPWQNVTVIGTTDVEHLQPLSLEPAISQLELDYLLDCIQYQFPDANIENEDIISTFAGVRPVVAGHTLLSNKWMSNKWMSKTGLGKNIKSLKPSQEKREHSIWQQPGLISIAGGKLTTFRVIAVQVLKLVLKELNIKKSIEETQVFEQTSAKIFNELEKAILEKSVLEKIRANYGQLAYQFLQQTKPEELNSISYSKCLWADLIWAAKYEQVMHLDDLLFRRTRIGNVLPNGAMDEFNKIKPICLQYLNWTEEQWQYEAIRYEKIWKTSYSLPKLADETI